MDPQSSYSLLEEPEKNKQDYMVAFSGSSQSYCIGMVDIVNSTKISANLHEREWCKYYVIFLNSMTKILRRFGAIPIKNGGDSLLYYFPESADPKKKFGFIGCLECNLAMTESHQLFSEAVEMQGLPSLNYRVSSDFGKVVIMEPNSLAPMDIIGPPVNMCAKINHIAPKNGIIIGGDLYEMVKDLDYYRYKQAEGFSIGLKYTYPVYTVSRKI
jgi:class 3 adenylate cyclase